MTAEQMWQAYIDGGAQAAGYTAWAFCGGGELGDQLARLVLDGVKTATASSHIAYQAEDEPLPAVGDHSVILWDDGSAACIIRNTQVTITPFDRVTARHAYLEGEGDRSLDYWRAAHRPFFTDDYAACGLPFDEHGLCVLEEFALVWK